VWYDHTVIILQLLYIIYYYFTIVRYYIALIHVNKKKHGSQSVKTNGFVGIVISGNEKGIKYVVLNNYIIKELSYWSL